MWRRRFGRSHGRAAATVQPGRAATRPTALVYRGPAGCDGCSEPVAALLRESQWGFDVSYVGPRERLTVSPETLTSAVLYAQPGGDGDVEDAYRRLRGSARTIRDYVNAGGRYVGICMGGYLAGSSPGFDLLPNDTDQFITSPNANVTDEADTVIEVMWRERPRYMYFQDGPVFPLGAGARDVIVLARYASNGTVAALVAPFGRGRVAVCGPHPEATEEWYRAADVANPDGVHTDLGHDLIDTLMGPPGGDRRPP